MTNNTNTEEKDTELIFITVRDSAVRILSRFERSDAYIDKLLQREILNSDFISQDKALLMELVNGVVRWRWKLDWILAGFYHGDYLKCLNIVKNALRVALYQILFLDRIPDHASINEAVELVKRVQGQKTASLVNGVLRNIIRNLEVIRYPERGADSIYFLSVMQSHPRWMVRKWVDRFGEEETELLLDINNRRPYLPVRVNSMKYSHTEFSNLLQSLDMEFIQSSLIENTFILNSPRMNIADLEEFKEGKLTIQDPSASLAVKLANSQKGWEVIDLCAAPGGKSLMLAEMMQDSGTITAIDKYESKLHFINDAVARMGFKSIVPITEDATTIRLDKKVDLVFVDAPCSGLGTLSKKPDIKWKREREDLYNLVALQKSILDNAINLVGVGGVIVYSTCTIEPEENTEVAEWFLRKYPEFELDPAENYLPAKICSNGYMQIFQHRHLMDGAFAARFVKVR